MFTKIRHVAIHTENYDRMAKFYQTIFGMKKITTGMTDETGAYHVELTHNYAESEYELGNQFGHLAFGTEDLEPVIAEVEKRGWWYRRSRPEVGSKYIFLKDPDGYDVEILERL